MTRVRCWPGRLRRASPWQVLLVGFALLLAWDASGLDLTLSQAFGGAQGFPWQQHPLALALHTGGRLLTWAVLGLLVLNVWWPLPMARGLHRTERVGWLVSTLLAAALVAGLKQHSLTSCPWSLARFGGTGQHVSHWLLGVADGGPGGCFPSGHSSSAFSMLSGYFALKASHRRAARWWLGGTLIAGALFSTVQLVRGAHFLSHSLWAAWLCGLTALCVHQLTQCWMARTRRMPCASGHLHRPPNTEAMPL